MRSMLRTAATFIFALSLALGTVGFMAGRAEAAAITLCPTGVDIFGNPTCPPAPCGFLGLSTCAWHRLFINGVYWKTVCGC